MLEIEEIEIKSIPIIQKLAYEIWPIHYTDIFPKEQILYMMELMYSTTSLEKQFLELEHNFIIAKLDEQIIGFASYQINFENSNNLKIHKIYLSETCRGKNIGNRIIEYIHSIARINKMNCIILNVHIKNKSIGFYKKIGFEIIEQVEINIGRNYILNDYIMTKNASS